MTHRVGAAFSILIAMTLWSLVAPRLVSAQPADRASEVEIAVERFGVSDQVRPADWAGVRIAVTDLVGKTRNSVVRMAYEDADGDTVYLQRTVTINANKTVGFWLYGLMPPDVASRVFVVTAHEADTSAADDELRVGRQIGATRIQPTTTIPEGMGLIAVVGRNPVGLDAYATTAPKSARRSGGFPPTGHELTRILVGVSPSEFPDRWMGLAPLEAIVWVGDSAAEQPTELSTDQARALREWVRRGGHLIIALPPVGGTWTSSRNPLADLMPVMTIDRREEVDLEPYRAMLTSSVAPMASRATLSVLTPDPEAGVEEAGVILAGPDRSAVAVRRLVGIGAVTVIGFDLPRVGPRIDAQRLWHRILGRRAAALTSAEMTKLGDKADFTNRRRVWLDSEVGQQINMMGRASAGVLMALVVFAAYLVLAGPLGFAVLKMMKKQHHSWVAFTAVAGFFSIIAWGGATLMRPSDVAVRHITFLDHVYGQPLDRARTWFSVVLPTYSRQQVSLGAPEDATRWHQALSPWKDPSSSGDQSFPDPRAYVLNARQPDSLIVPTRSTVKQFQAQWLGPPPWGMPRPIDERILLDSSGGLQGALTHQLPGALRNVRIILVLGQRPFVDVVGGPLLARTRAWALTEWRPGARLDLDQLTKPGTADAYFRDLSQTSSGFNASGGIDGGIGAPQDAMRKLAMLAWQPMIEPPKWSSLTAQSKVVLQRRITHGLDLARWFTQPSLIIVGELEDAPSPAPIFVDGELAESTGRVYVRWVYPLPANPVFPESDQESEQEPASWR